MAQNLLDEKRVWYDAEQASGQVARTFATPTNKVVLVSESSLRARRQGRRWPKLLDVAKPLTDLVPEEPLDRILLTHILLNSCEARIP